jgi:hypothetical protein
VILNKGVEKKSRFVQKILNINNVQNFFLLSYLGRTVRVPARAGGAQPGQHPGRVSDTH